MERNIERLKELLILTERYKEMIDNKQMTEQDLRGALEAIKEELKAINRENFINKHKNT